MSEFTPQESSKAVRNIYSRLTKTNEPVAERPAAATGTRLQAQEAYDLCHAFEALNLGSFWSTDAEGRITYMSGNAEAALGSGRDLLGQSFLEMFRPPEGDGDRKRTLTFAFVRKLRFDRVVASSQVGGKQLWWSISGEAQYDSYGEFAGFKGHLVDVTSERQSAEESSALAMNDPLTGLLNRRHMAQLLERTITAYAVQRRSCATMFIDLDRFKQVNDTLGHPVGDALLKQVAERLVRVVGDKDRVCRLGGDEFQVILPDVDDRGRLGDLAGSIITTLSEPYSIDGNRCLIGASIGVAVSPFDGENSDDLVRNADLALYAAKRDGRGRFRFYSNDLLKTAENRKQLEEDLHDVLPKGELSLVYQPIVDAQSGRVTGAETLVRWNHPEMGGISPATFIPIAEESQLILRIGEWILRKACDDAASWPVPLRIAVNVSPVQFAHESLPKIVMSALATSGLDPDRLELEITEGVFVQEGNATNAMFKALKALGIRLALDDFGTGYSSLGYLKNAPFDKIKIDQSFVRGATQRDTRTKAIISAIVTLADALDMETTAEGVESFDQLELIKALHVSHVQGYLFSKPVPAEELIEGLTNGDWVLAPAGPAKQRNGRMAMYRTAGVIHEDHYYPVTLRNLSTTGALIEGILDVPVGTRFVVDFGDGQIALSTVRRSKDHQQGVEFDTEMVNDGNGGLCTRQRILPRHLIAAGIPQNTDEFLSRQVAQMATGKISLPKFALANKVEVGTFSGPNGRVEE